MWEHDKQSCSEQSWVEGDLFKIDLRVQGVPQNAVPEDQGRVTKIRDLVKTLSTEYRTESVTADLSKTGGIQQIQWGIHKDHPKVGKDRISWIGKSFNENTVRVLRQVLARRTGLLLLRTLSKAYERVEAKDKGTISRLVKFLLHSEEELFARCKAMDEPKSSTITLKRMNQRDMRRRKTFSSVTGRWHRDKPIPKISNCRRMDRRTLSTFGFAHGNWFFLHSYAERASTIWEQ